MDTSLLSDILDEFEEMDIGELYFKGIEKSCSDKVKGYVPQEQVITLKEATLKAKFSSSLGINSGSFKETKKSGEDGSKKPGRKSNKHRVVDVGRRLVDSGQYPTIKAALGL